MKGEILRRLEQLESSTGANEERIKVERYDISPEGDLILLPDHYRLPEVASPTKTIQCIFVDSDGAGGPGPRYLAYLRRNGGLDWEDASGSNGRHRADTGQYQTSERAPVAARNAQPGKAAAGKQFGKSHPKVVQDSGQANRRAPRTVDQVAARAKVSRHVAEQAATKDQSSEGHPAWLQEVLERVADATGLDCAKPPKPPGPKAVQRRPTESFGAGAVEDNPD